MKKLFFALVAILYLLLVIGCPPSTPNKDAFGSGPTDRDLTTDTTDDGTDTTTPPTTDGSAVDGEPIDGSAADGDIGGTGDSGGDVTPPDAPAAPDDGGGE